MAGSWSAAAREGKLNNLVHRTGARSGARHHRHRPHPLGDPRRADRRQRAPPRHRRSGAGPQRHHREFPPAARGADRARPRVRKRDRYRSRRPPGVRRGRGGQDPRKTRSRPPCRSCAAPSRSPSLSAAPRHADRRAARLAAGGRLWRGRDLSRLRRARARAAHPAITYLEEGDWVVITREGAQIFDMANNPVEREIVASGASAVAIEKGNYRHFMQKEIFEQPTVVAQTCAAISARSTSRSRCRRSISTCRDQPRHHRRLRHQLLCRDGREILVRTVRPPARRHRCGERIPLPRSGAGGPGGLALFISQSGETADTLAALRHCKACGPDHRRGRQRADQFDGARGRPAAAHPCRAGDRRRLHQGLHLPACRAGRAGRAPCGKARVG
jgi:hypothetical protein